MYGSRKLHTSAEGKGGGGSLLHFSGPMWLELQLNQAGSKRKVQGASAACQEQGLAFLQIVVETLGALHQEREKDLPCSNCSTVCPWPHARKCCDAGFYQRRRTSSSLPMHHFYPEESMAAQKALGASCRRTQKFCKRPSQHFQRSSIAQLHSSTSYNFIAP